MKADFVAQPVTTLDQLQQQVVQFANKLGIMVGGQYIANVSVGTTATTIPHTLGSIPSGVFLSVPSAGATFLYSQPSDKKNIYLQASAPCTVSLWVI